MDTSDEYIKMCEKAEEIQKDWIPDYGDFHVTYDDTGNVCFTDVFSGHTDYRFSKFVWLPRQDQLQEMIGEYLVNKRIMYLILNKMGVDMTFGLFDSFEQLWLGIVMYTKHHKKWDGSVWIDKDLAESMQHNDSLMKKLSKL